MTRIALTGATGRVGSRLLPRLLARGYEVTALVRTGTVSGATVVNGDLNDDNALKELVHGADAVLHLAAGLRTDTNHEATNVGGTRKLVEAAKEVPRFVHVSTNLVYPEGLGRPSTEDDPTEPPAQWGEYAKTKAQAEKVLDNATIVRLAFVYGEGDPHLRESLRWASTWPAHHRLHLIHHADVAQALFLALDAPGTGVYNAADDSPMTAAELHQLNGVPRPTEPPTQQPDPWHGIVSTNRIQRELGFRPRFPSAWSAYHAGAL